MGDVVNNLTEFWKRRGVAPAAEKATVTEIDEWQRRYKVVLPTDLRRYLLKVNGILNGEVLEFDHEGISFLPLSAMCRQDEWAEPGESDRFVFADFLIRSHWWCVALDDRPHEETRIYIGGGLSAQNRLVAGSLSEFFHLYMNDHMSIYPR
jgi:hypothetical protein